MMTVEEMQKRKRESGLSYEEISQRSGVPFGTVQKVLSGTTGAPRHKTLAALEKAFMEDPGSSSYGPRDTCDLSPVSSDQASPAAGHAAAHIPTPYRTAPPTSGSVRESSSAAYGADSICGHSAPEERDLSTVPDFSAAARKKYPRQGQYTLEDYLKLPADQRAELIDGVLYDMSSPSMIHQTISSELTWILTSYIRENKGTCQVFYAPTDVQLDQDSRTIVEPDIMVICDPDKIHRERIYGAPDLIIEILSPSTRRKDMTLKMWKYANAGVREYWIVDPDQQKVIVYRFQPELILNQYTFHDKVPVGICHGKLIVDFEDIWQRIARFY